MSTISLCMIVKNEEAVLERCLNSVCDLVDEIIIVDTGSTDDTKKIAKKYTHHIFDFQWNYDFSAARNFSFQKATMDYIYVADADEVINEENRKKFADLKKALLPEIEIVQMIYCNQLSYNTTYNFDEEYRPKLYKRQRMFTWEDPIHESVSLTPVVYDSDIRIQHLPLCNHSKRDFDAFQRLLKNGMDLSKKLHHMYARELYITGTEKDFLQAEPYFKKAAGDVKRSIEEVKEAACILSRAARLKKDVNQLLKYACKELASEPSSEICFELGEYYYDDKDYEEAAIWYYNAAYEAASILNIHYSGRLPLERLAACYQIMGNEEQAERYEKLAQEWTPMGGDI
ncbi:MAG: glycosyltransferase [Acetivibrio sp.]